MPPCRFRSPADYDEVEFKRIISLMSVESLDRLYAIAEELQDDGRDADVVAIARELYEQDWARLNAALPAIPSDIENLIDDDYWFSCWGPDNIDHAVRLRNDAIARARRRKKLDDAVPILPDECP
jgi:hypothetical protein